MTSGKVSKRRRREARVPPPPGARRQASPKVLIGAALAVALIVLAIVLGFVFTGGSSSSNTPARGSLAGGLPGAADAQRLFRGIPQHGNVLGSPKAPVTVVEYVDLQCPFCQEFETKAMPTLLSRYVRSGKVKIEARPIAFIGPDSERGRAGAWRPPSRIGCSTTCSSSTSTRGPRTPAGSTESAVDQKARRWARRKEVEVIEVGQRRNADEAVDLGPAHQQLHRDPGSERDAGDPAGLRVRLDDLQPIEGRGRVGKLAGSAIPGALAAPDAAEIEPQHRESAGRKRMIQRVNHLIVHRPAELRVRVQNERDGAVAAVFVMVTGFQATAWAIDNKFGHQSFLSLEWGWWPGC